MEDKIAIYVSAFNAEETLPATLDSILNQTYKNIKLIISDDNSQNKDVITTLKEYEEKDSRIKVYLQEKNLGYLKNFEFLLAKSDAEYIAYADHDDIWYENKLEKCIKEIINKDADLVYSDCQQIDENGQTIHESYLKYKNMPILNGKDNILTFSRHIAIGCSTIFTKKIKEQMLPFTDGVMAHDWLNMYLASKQKGIVCINEPLFEYRLHLSNEFGGRSLNQNLSKWKKENGSSYASFKKYRNERVIQTAYLNGSLMCKEYRDKLNLPISEAEEKVVNYYNRLLNTRIINLHFCEYKIYLSFKGIGKRKIKEMLIFHFPPLAFLAYKFSSKY